MNEGLHLSEAGLVASGLLTNSWEPATREQLLAALMHHDRIVEDLARLMRQAAYVHRMYGRKVMLIEATQQPVMALLGFLDRHPRLSTKSGRAPSEVLTEQPPLGGPWRDLNRALLVAAHTWAQACAPPPGEVQWGVVADVAAIARAVSLLHSDLIRAANRFRLFRVAKLLRSPPSVGLRWVSAAALETAQAGPTRDDWRPATSRQLSQLIGDLHGVIEPVEIPEATRALARVLHHPGLHLDAETTVALLRNHAATSLIVGHYMNQRGDTRGPALIQHGEVLARVPGSLKDRVWSEPSAQAHRRPLAQAQQLHQVIRTHLRGSPTELHSQALATEYGVTVPAITNQLNAHLQRAMHYGLWMTINRDTDRPDLHWRPVRGADFLPARRAMQAALRVVADLGPTEAPALPGAVNHPNSAHRLLAPALARAAATHHVVARPPRP